MSTTSNYTLYKWDKKDTKQTTIDNTASTMDTIDKVLKDQSDRINNIVGNIGNSNSEIVDARGIFPVLKSRLDSVDLSLAQKAAQTDLNTTNNTVAQKADKTYVDQQIGNIGSASPKGTYASLSALQTAFPTGTTGVYLTTDNGHWYFWNGSAWTDGGVYQGFGLDPSYINTPMTNLVTNGNFSSTSNWLSSNATFSVSANAGNLLATATNGKIYQSKSLTQGHKYYFGAYVKATSNLVKMDNFDGTTDRIVYHSGSGNYELLSNIITASANLTNNIYTLMFLDGRTSGWDTVNIQWVIMLDLTAIFGAGNEPTKDKVQEFLSVFTNKWFDGTRSALDGKLLFTNDNITNNANSITQLNKSILSSLFNWNSWVVGALNSTDGTETSSSNRIRSDYIQLTKGTMISAFDSSVQVIGDFYSLTDKSFISNIPSWTSSFIVPFDCYIRIVMRNSDDSVITDANSIGAKCNITISSTRKSNYSFDYLYSNTLLLTDLNSWKTGNILSDGTEGTTSTRAKTDYMRVDRGTIVKSLDPTLQVVLAFYSLTNKTYLSQTTSWSNMGIVPYDCFLRVVIRYTDDRVISDYATASQKVSLSKINSNDKYEKRGRDLLYKFPGTLGQSICFVGDELWAFEGADNVYSPVHRYSLDYTNETITEIGSFTQNWGHNNTTTYCKGTDSLIGSKLTGLSESNGVGGDKTFFILPNATSFKNLTTVPLETYAIQFDVSALNWGKQVWAVWGENNNRKYNIVYVITNDTIGTTESDTNKVNMYFRKLLLGQGANQLENGTFIAGKTGLEYNGTFKVLETFTSNANYSPYECTQGGIFYNGKIYTGMGHDGIWIAEITLNEDLSATILKTRERYWYDDAGATISLITQAMTIKDDKLYIRVYEGKTQTVSLNVYRL